MCAHVSINRHQVLVVDSEPLFPIGFTMPPPPDGRTPQGKNAIAELREAGATMLRSGVMGVAWDDAHLRREQQWQDAAARHGMICAVNLRETASIAGGGDGAARAAMLRRIVNLYRRHPAMGVWIGVDEPEWGKHPIPPLLRARRIILELDPGRPIFINHAPRGTVETLRPYNAAGDITGVDVYPVSYPPGIHSLLPNKEISMVGDYTRTMMQVAGGKMPVWVYLQIAWSGVVKPGRTLRFPSFPQQRFMAYQAIINGARGLIFFGGQLAASLSAEDARLGWNWSFWRRVLRPVIEEIGRWSPLYPALLAPNSLLPIGVSGVSGVSGAADVEFCAREVGNDLFLLACKREGATVQVEFTGLPPWAGRADVLFESPRTVAANAGRFTDWFAPFDVHVYHFRRG